MNTLTKEQIARQDFVDNQVFELINSLLAPSRQIEWDIEIIGNAREAIRKEIGENAGIDEKQFYPFLAEI